MASRSSSGAKQKQRGKVKLHAPLESIVWMDPNELTSNDYNPNRVMAQEMELLKLSVERTGWLQPILITPKNVIIDGFHRTTLGRLNGWLVPCCILDIDEKERMLLTVRINRAKGTHIALRMSDLIQQLIALGCTEQYIAEQIGASEREITILKKGDIFKSIDLSKWSYSRAWLPKPYREAKGQAS